MERSGFFNAQKSENGQYDRVYSANDYSDNLAVIISNGVVRSQSDDLKVSADAMTVTVNTGRAFINGHWYHNDADYTFDESTTPLVGARWDRVVLRYDNTKPIRAIGLKYITGTAAISPEKPEITRTSDVFDLCLADIYVEANASSVTVTDTRADNDICGWVYSTSGDGSFFATLDNRFNSWLSGLNDTLATTTIEVEYKQITTLSSASNNIQITMPQYDSTINQKLNVYINGMLATDYTVSGSTITFGSTLIGGTKITVVLTVAKDGTGIDSVVGDVSTLQNKVAALEQGLENSTYTYICSGNGDNIKLSQLIGTGTKAKVNVYGTTFGVTSACNGNGTTVSPYKWFDIDADDVVIDFSGCAQITIPVAAGTTNVIFGGNNIHIIGASIAVMQDAENTVVMAFSGNGIGAERCTFDITAYKDSVVAANGGNYIDCTATIVNQSGNSYCFKGASGKITYITRGKYCAYTASSTDKSAVVGHESTGAVTILSGVNAPTAAQTGLYQTNSIIQATGAGKIDCTALISTLTLSVDSANSAIRGTIQA